MSDTSSLNPSIMEIPSESVILHGRAQPEFAKQLATTLEWALIPVNAETFADGETHIVIEGSVSGKDVYIVQSTSYPANDTLMELLLLTEAAVAEGATRITAVMPFFGYRRQEKRSKPGEALSFALVAKLLKTAGIDRVMVMDLHKHRSRKFFEEAGVECVELAAFPVFIDYLIQKDRTNLMVLAPDKGSVPSSADYAQRLGIPMIVANKTRSMETKDTVSFEDMIADVEGKDILIIDDEINTAATLVGVVDMMNARGAKTITVGCTHAVLSPPAIDRMQHAGITECMITDTIAQPKEKQLPLFQTLSVVPLFAEALKNWK
jgi:ribose-phosphate pyrophosphokinase